MRRSCGPGGAVRVIEGEGGGSGERAGGRGDVEGFVEAGGEGRVVGVEREGIAELLGGLGVDEVQRLAVRVLVLLEDPVGDLSATVGEGYAVELVLDCGGGFSCGLNSGDGRGCGHRCRGCRLRGGLRSGWGGRLGCGGGTLGGAGDGVGRDRLGVCFGAEVLQAEEYGDEDEHHDKERLVVAAALLIWVFKLCQKGLPILY